MNARDLDAQDSPKMDSAESGPARHSLSAGPGCPVRNLSYSLSETSTLSPSRHQEDAAQEWERGFESLGVTKCGVCGMKLPLDVAEIEQHSLECESASKEGRRPARPDSSTLKSVMISSIVDEYPVAPPCQTVGEGGL